MQFSAEATECFQLKMFVFYYVCFEWPPIGKIAAHSAFDMFSWYKYQDPVVQN